MKIPPILMSKKWTRCFLISHILGWTLANIQTVWIIYEIRKNMKKLEKIKDKI